MKYPVIYIKGKQNLASQFAKFIDEPLNVMPDITSAMRTLLPMRAEHAFILYEQSEVTSDCNNIRFLRSWFPACAILLIVDRELEEAERRDYLNAGVNNAIPATISAQEFHRTMQFIDNYTFSHQSATAEQERVRLFHMPLWKRVFDIVAATGAIAALSPLLVGVAIAIKFDSPGPIVYRSKRVGSNYRVFDFLKFRSMRSDADKQLKELEDKNQYASETSDEDAAKITFDPEEMSKLLANTDDGMLFSDDFAIAEQDHLHQVETEQENAFVKIENDPRITPLGRFLRKYSIDELPQLFNILLGDMSVVGNRPLPLYEAERLTSDEYIERFMCPSGLTGLWQVEKRGHAGKLSPEQRKQLDIRYAREMSFWFDMKIIMRTFTAFIQKENV